MKTGKIIIIVLTVSFFTTIFTLAAVYVFSNNFLTAKNSELSKEPAAKPTPWLRIPRINSISASEISEVRINSWFHAGLLFSTDAYVSDSQFVIERNGNVLSKNKKDFTDGKTPDEVSERRGKITPEQFEKLAQIIVENNFFDADDAPQITERGDTLTVVYSGKVKEIKMSNARGDTPEIKAILQAMEDLKDKTVWKN